MNTCRWKYWAVVAVATVATGLIVGSGCPSNALTITATATPTTGTGSTQVTLTGTVTGGTAPYSLLWVASPAVAITNATSLNASATITNTTTFTLTAVDSANPPLTAFNIATVTISGPAALAVTATATPSKSINSTAIALAATATGGTAPITFAWTANPAVTITDAASANASATPTVTTAFTVTATDAASQQKTASVQVLIGDAANGLTKFNASCGFVGCHASNASTVLKPNAGKITNDMSTVVPGGAFMTGITLTDQEVLDLQAYLASLP